VEWQEYWKALGAWQCEMSARWSGTKFCLATREARQAILGVEAEREEDFFKTHGVKIF